MSSPTERRLRKQFLPEGITKHGQGASRFCWDEIVEAARIGAEIERAACDEIARALGDEDVAIAIRERGAP